MSSNEIRPLPLFQLIELQKIVRRLQAQFGHLRSHIEEPDEVTEYWISHVFRHLLALDDELCVMISDEKEFSDGQASKF